MPVYTVNVVLEDDQGRQTAREILFDVADETALLVATGTMMTAYQAVSFCGIQSYTYRRSVTLGNTPGAGSNIDAGMTLLWATPLVIDPTTKVPDPVAAILDGQGGIDLADALMTTFFAEYNPGSAVLNANNPTQPTAIRRGTLDK